MTKVQITFKLTRSLTQTDLVNISRVHSVYGFFAVRLKPAGDALFVEYDASRMSRKEVRASFEEHGLPIEPLTPAPAVSDEQTAPPSAP